MENECNQRLVLFQSENEIIETEKRISNQYQTPIEFMTSFRSDGSPLGIVQSAYAITQAWKPFWDYGCTPEELSIILQYNALVCSLMSLKYLSCPSVDVIETLSRRLRESNIYPGNIKDFIKDAKAQKKEEDENQSGSYEDYFNNCLLNMISQSDSKANPIFLPAIEALLLNRNRKRRIDKDFRSLYRISGTYIHESNTSDELLRKQQSRLNASYDRFYNTLRDVVRSVPKPEDSGDKAITEFLKELIFHHRALSKCERDLSGLTVRGNMSFECQIDTILMALQYRCQIPLVFGADSFSFPGGKQMHALGQYYDFVNLTAISYYEKAHRDVKEACNLIRQCLKNNSFFKPIESGTNFSKFPDNLIRQDDKNILGKYYAQRARKVIDCFSQYYYYGNQNNEYTMTRDDLLNICTDHDNLCQQRNAPKGNFDKLHNFDSDLHVIVFEFEDKETKEAALAYPDALKTFLKETYDLRSDEMVFVVPK